MVVDTAVSGVNLLYPIYIGASTISTKISTIPEKRHQCLKWKTVVSSVVWNIVVSRVGWQR